VRVEEGLKKREQQVGKMEVSVWSILRESEVWESKIRSLVESLESRDEKVEVDSV